MSIKGQAQNKGEWAELYVFMKLLGEGKLYAADEHLNKKKDSYLEVFDILREEIVGLITRYSTQGAPGYIEIYKNDTLELVVEAREFLSNANSFFYYLKDEEHRLPRKGAVRAPEWLERFADEILITKPKSPALRSAGSFGGKVDIVIVLRDARNSLVGTSGFSIKSQFASAPTLFNAGATSQLLFRMDGMTDNIAKEFNDAMTERGTRDWTRACRIVAHNNIEPVFVGTQYPTLSGNLMYIRETMEQLLAEIYKRGVLLDREHNGVKEICESIAKDDPLGYGNRELYEKVVKDFLFASFSGMTAGTKWDGTEQVNGGYIVVLDDGEVLCYHANDREEFRDYLFKQTFIEYVSCKKYAWGYVYKDGGDWMLPLNASVRFYKKVK